MNHLLCYAIRLADGSWYRSHGKWNGNGCVQSEVATFPTALFAKCDAEEKLKRLVFDFPNEVGARVMEINYTIKDAK